MLLDARIIFILLTFQECSLLSSPSLVVRVFFKEGTLCNSIRFLFFHCNLPFCGFCLVLRHISSAAFTSLSCFPVCDFLRYSRTTFINQSSPSIFFAFIYLYLLHLFLLSSPSADNNIDSVCCYSFFFFTVTPIIFHLQRSFFVLRILLRSIFSSTAMKYIQIFFYLVSDFNFNFLL